MLEQFTKNCIDTTLKWKACVTGLQNKLYVLLCSECLPIIILHIFTKSEVSVIKRRQDFLSKIKCNQ